MSVRGGGGGERGQRALVQCFCTMDAGLYKLAVPHHLHPSSPSLSITSSSSATITVSLVVKSTEFQLGFLIFHFLSLFIGFSSREETRSWSTHLASSPVHESLLFFGDLSKLLRSRLRFYVDL